MPAPLLDPADVDFLLFDWLRAQELCARPQFAEHDRGSLAAAVELARELSVERLAPAAEVGDREEPRIVDGHAALPEATAAAVQALADTGLTWAALPARDGGSDLPMVVHTACKAWLQAANIGACAYPMLTLGNASLLLAHGTPDQQRRFVEPMVAGRFYGTMCLSEPEAGSALADVATRAVPQDDGGYRLYGTKMWISAGDHLLGETIVHLVLARVPGDGPGVRGLSLFAVPTRLVGPDGQVGEPNDVALAGLNHKMGYRGTVNAVLAFGGGEATPDGRPGAVGELVGQRGRGLAAMFHMMNAARISVGAGAAALGYAGYRYALDYARERRQGRPLADKDPSAPPVRIVTHPDVRRMLLAAKSYAEGGLALVLYAAKLLDDARSAPQESDRQDSARLLDVLTPIVKSWPSTYGLAANDLAIQVLGGAGYTRDHPVERLYRDNRLNPIHEGTHGIQGLDLLGRRAIADGGAGLAVLLGRIEATAAAARADHPVWAEALSEAAAHVGDLTRRLWAGGDPEAALAGAGVYLDAVGHVVVAWLWLEQVRAAAGRGDALEAGKSAAARYFFTFELPIARARLATIDPDGAASDLLNGLDDATL